VQSGSTREEEANNDIEKPEAFRDVGMDQFQPQDINPLH
jgi:hypothetical protein